VLNKLVPITLEGKDIVLRSPLLDDIEGLSNATMDGEIWTSHFSRFPHPNEIPTYLGEMLELSSWFNFAIYYNR
jgi:N-acetyltransferase